MFLDQTEVLDRAKASIVVSVGQINEALHLLSQSHCSRLPYSNLPQN